MPDVSGPGGGTPTARPHLPPTAGLDGLKYRTAAEAALEPESPAAHQVGWGFISLYTLAYISTSLVFIAPLLVTLALKVNSLVGIERAPDSLALVAGIGALLAMFGNPFFGKMSDRTSSRLGMRRPWMVIGLWAVPSASSLSRWPPASRWSSSDGASPSCSSTHCSPPWWRCCPTRSRPLSAAWSPVSLVSVCLSRR
jgi:MFS family permease